MDVNTAVSLFAVIDSWRQWRSAMMTAPCHTVRLSQQHGDSKLMYSPTLSCVQQIQKQATDSAASLCYSLINYKLYRLL